MSLKIQKYAAEKMLFVLRLLQVSFTFGAWNWLLDIYTNSFDAVSFILTFEIFFVVLENAEHK